MQEKGELDVRYDLDNDGKLLMPLSSPEASAIIQSFTVQPSPPTDGKIVFYTGPISNPRANGTETIGFASINGFFAFVSSAVSGDALLTLFAHEIGHTLGATDLPASHSSEVMVGTNVGTACGVRKGTWDAVNSQ